MELHIKNRSLAAGRAWIAVAMAALLVGCMQSADEKYTGYMERGAAYAEESDHASAIIEFRNAARAKPLEAEPFFQLAKSYSARGRAEEAFVAVGQATQLDPNHADASLLMAQFLVRSGPEYLPQAEELLNNVLTDRPGNSDALFVLAATRARLGSESDAEDLLQEALTSTPDHLKSSIGLARLKLSQGDREGAEQVLADAVDKASDKRQAKLALAQFYLGTQRNDDAAREIDEILESDPAYGPALLGKGLMLVRAGELDQAEEIYKRASKLPGAAYKPLYAVALQMNGKTDESLAEFGRLYEEDPSDRDIRKRLVAAYAKAGRVDAAEEVLAKVIDENPKDTEALLQRADLYLNSKRADLAEDDLTQVLEFRPSDPRAHYLLSKIYAVNGNPARQRQELEETLRLDRSFLAARLDMAQSLLRGQSPRSALDVLEEAPENQRKHVRLMSARVWALIALREFDEARTALTAAQEAAGDSAEFTLQDGVLLAARGKHSEGRVALTQALEQSPGDLRALNALAGSYLAEKKVVEALGAVSTHADKYPQSPSIQLTAAKWHQRAGSDYVEKTRSFFERAVKAGDPQNEAGLQLARMELRDKKHGEAEQRITRILSKQSANVEARLLLSTLYEGSDRKEEAEQEYRYILNDASPSPTQQKVALNNLAYLLATNRGELDEALKFAQQAKELAASDTGGIAAMIDDTLGWVYYLKELYPSAVQHLQAATEKAPKAAVMHYHLAMAYAQDDKAELARESYAQGKELDPDMAEAAEAQRVLEAASR